MEFLFKMLRMVLPVPIRQQIKTALRRRLRARALPVQSVDLSALKAAHIRDARLLVDRKELLTMLPKTGVVAEIGVAEGTFSQAIWTQCTPRQLHLIDAWDSERYGKNMQEGVEKLFQQEILAGKVQLHQGLSVEIGQQFPDAYFDWIYLDTDHSYLLTKKELELFSRKVKADGIIAGHDFVNGNFETGLRYGVMEAVLEFCIHQHWQLLYLTIQPEEHPSFAIRRIGEQSEGE